MLKYLNTCAIQIGKSEKKVNSEISIWNKIIMRYKSHIMRNKKINNEQCEKNKDNIF